MGLDTPEMCRGWRSILRISRASSWVFFTRSHLLFVQFARLVTYCRLLRSKLFWAFFFVFMGPCILNKCQSLSNKMRLCIVYYISVNCYTCFGWNFHSSSGAHITVIKHLALVKPPLLPSAIAEGNRDDLTNARCCNYSYMCSWRWVELPPETCRAVYRNIVDYT